MNCIWIAVDFDKTLAEYTETQDWYECGKPLKGAIAFLKALKKTGFKVAIFSARAMDPAGKAGIIQWTQEYAPGLVDMVTHEKYPMFFLIVDDRAIYFDGHNYVEILKEILRRTGVEQNGLSKETSGPPEAGF